MKYFYAYLKSAFISILLLTVVIHGAHAQNRTLTAYPYVPIDLLINAYYESLPGNYNPSLKYPLIVFFHGSGQFGDGRPEYMPRVLENSLPKLINENNFPNSFTVYGETFSPIVIIPQMTEGAAGETGVPFAIAAVNNTIDYALAHYPIDTNRIYLMGISKGGGFVLWGAGSTPNNARRLAGIVTISAAGSVIASGASNMAANDLPVLAISSQSDGWNFVSQGYTTAINANNPPPDTAARLIAVPGDVHDLWVYPPFNSASYQPVPGRTIYEWMFSQQQTGGVLPVALQDYKVTAGNGAAGNKQALLSWTTSFEQNNSFFTIERSADGSTFTTIGQVPAGTQGRGNSYAYTDPAPLDGTSYYRLSQTDKDGSVKKFSAKSLSFFTSGAAASLKIYPNPLVTRHLVVELSNPVKGVLYASIISADGKILLTQVMAKPDQFLRKVIPTGTLGKGLYLLKITGDNYESATRFIKE